MATTYIPPMPAPAPVPIYDNALENVFHDNIVGVMTFDPTLVRPRWQPEPPNQPAFTTDWVAFGVTVTDSDKFAYQVHDPTANSGLGADQFEKDERIEILLSFYGPNSYMNSKLYGDGLQIDRNRDDLLAYGIKFVEVSEARNVPALLKDKWVKRVDVTATFRRRIKRTYGIVTVVGIAPGTINNEQYTTSFKLP